MFWGYGVDISFASYFLDSIFLVRFHHLNLFQDFVFYGVKLVRMGRLHVEGVDVLSLVGIRGYWPLRDSLSHLSRAPFEILRSLL